MNGKVFCAVMFGIALLLNSPDPANALSINATFDSSIASDLSPTNAASWHSAINYVDGEMAALFSDPITINITFAANPGTNTFGESNYFTHFVGNYSAMKTALTADATSADDLLSVATLPATDPSAGSSFYTTTAQAKALGLIAANNPATDGTVTLGAGFNYTYDPNHRAVSGKYDFIGIVEHEVTEVMGRAGVYNLENYGALDLFGYQFGAGGTGTGTLNLAPFQASNYFSIDGGQTALKLNNNASNGEDDKDWGAGTNDSFNAFSFSGVANAMSAVDLREMDVIGYNLAVPEPSSLLLLALGGTGLLPRYRRHSPRPRRLS